MPINGNPSDTVSKDRSSYNDEGDKNRDKQQSGAAALPVPHITTDVLIIGAGASGLYCALAAGKRGRSVLVIDHANKAGKKILMSGGGRCNFTNYFVEPEHFICSNPHFCKSALSRYQSWDFIGLVNKHNIDYHEREHGQLFCDDSSKDILNMLLTECRQVGAAIRLNTKVDCIQILNNEGADKEGQQQGFLVTITSKRTKSNTVNNKANNTISNKVENNKVEDKNSVSASQQNGKQVIRCESLVVATGGLSIPTLGASGFGYEVATQFGHHIVTTTAALVPFTFTDKIGDMIASLAGLSLDVVAFNERISFVLPMLFTHRGLSGPAMLQLSNYWQVGESIHVNLLPNTDVSNLLLNAKDKQPKQRLRSALAAHLPKKLLQALQALLWQDIKETELANIKDERLNDIGHTLNDWVLKPSGTEGYRTAEVTRGGIATHEVSSKTFESKLQPNLYFIGEVLDVTGWLGGYNFQWAWASGDACGEVV